MTIMFDKNENEIVYSVFGSATAYLMAPEQIVL